MVLTHVYWCSCFLLAIAALINSAVECEKQSSSCPGKPEKRRCLFFKAGHHSDHILTVL